MAITALPTPPARNQSSATFSTNADAFLAALPQFATDANALQTDVNAKQTAAATSATNAATSETNAAASANAATTGSAAPKWVSGTTYAQGNCVWSPADFNTYRRIVAGAGTTDPVSDSTNWKLVPAVNGMGGLNAGNISVGRTMDKTYAAAQLVTPIAVGVKDTLPDATTLNTGIGSYFHKNGSDTYQHGLSDKGGTLRAVIGPNGKASSNLFDKSTAAGVWGIECDNEDGAMALCEQALSATYVGVLSLLDGNGGASRVNHNRTKTAIFISATAAVSVVTSASSTYLVGFDDTGLSAPQLLEAAVATIAMVVRTSATSGFVVWGYTNSVKIAGFTLTGNLPSVGSVTTLSSAISPLPNGYGVNGGLAWIVLDNAATWIVNAASSNATGSLWAITQSGNTATAGAALTATGTGGMPMLFSTGNTTFGQIGYQSGAAAAGVLQTNTVTGNTIANTASANYIASTTTSSRPCAIAKLPGTTKFAFVWIDGNVTSVNTNVATITSGTGIALGTNATVTGLTSGDTATFMNVYDATRYVVCNGGITQQAALTPKYFTESAGSPTLTNPGITIGSAQAQVVGIIDNATVLTADGAASGASPIRLRKISFNGSAFTYTGASVEMQTNVMTDSSSNVFGVTVCGGVVVSGNAIAAGALRFNFLNKGRSMRYTPRLATGSVNTGALVDANSAGTRVAACTKDFNSTVVPIMMEIPAY